MKKSLPGPFDDMKIICLSPNPDARFNQNAIVKVVVVELAPDRVRFRVSAPANRQDFVTPSDAAAAGRIRSELAEPGIIRTRL
jgi:hypothetical protein